MSTPLLEVKNLSRQFDVSKPWLNRVIERSPRQFLQAVDDVSFSIEKGETFALVGESGSGKSTIARLIVGLLKPTSGDILFEGKSLSSGLEGAEARRLRRRFQMIFQDPFASLNPRWRVTDIIAEPLRVFEKGTPQADQISRVGELLRLVGMSPEDGVKFPHEFSGGQRQRVAIARALAARPDFIVCDEPTSALDVSVQAQILNLMKDLQAEFGLTYLFISHDLSVVRHMANRIGVLYLGRLAETAEAKSLFRTPRHPYTRMLLDAVPDLEMSGRKRKKVEGEIPNPIDPPPGCSFHPRCPFMFEPCPKIVPLPTPTETGAAECHLVELEEKNVIKPRPGVWAEEVLAFWFGELTPEDWYTGKSDTDAAIRDRFLTLYKSLFAAVPDEARSDPEAALAAIILFDQFPRNMFRGQAAAFGSDDLALDLARNALDKGFDHGLEPDRRQFMYMPLMHSEVLADQERCISLFKALGNEEGVKYAVEHRDIIARFGRFPHRNRVLGRESGDEEHRFLDEHAGYGQ